MASQETDIPDAQAAAGNPDTAAASAPSQHSEEPETQESRTGKRHESDAKMRKPVPWKLGLNVTVTSASPEGQLTEMRDAFLKNLAQESGYDTYPFGKPEKRVHGLYIKHDGDTAADAFCPYHTRLHCPFRVKIRMTSQQLLIWTAYEHDHNPANDTIKHIKVATAKKVKQVIADAPISDIFFFSFFVRN